MTQFVEKRYYKKDRRLMIVLWCNLYLLTYFPEITCFIYQSEFTLNAKFSLFVDLPKYKWHMIMESE